MEMEACMTDNWSSKATLVSIQNRLLYNALGMIDGDRLRYDRLFQYVRSFLLSLILPIRTLNPSVP